MRSVFLSVAAVVVLGGCSKTSDFTPAAGMDGEAIFQSACAECHEANEAGYYFELPLTADIAQRIRTGGLMMPAFPNIHGEALKSLEEYVMAHSRVVD